MVILKFDIWYLEYSGLLDLFFCPSYEMQVFGKIYKEVHIIS
jgi:hypothetical protein